jgi:recombination associated protein RdgC
MFKNLILYRITAGADAITEDAIADLAFVPCSPSQDFAIGFVPPRGHAHGAFVERVAGQVIVQLVTETKKVPSDALARAVADRCAAIEVQTGRKPGRKETKEIKAEILLAMLPNAIATRASTRIWIDRAANLLAIDSGSSARADAAVTLLIRAINGLTISMINTAKSPQGIMAGWLTSQEWPEDFSPGREVELRAVDETRSMVRFTRHNIESEQISAHVLQGKLPTKLAMQWNERVNFIITDGLALKKIEFLDVVFDDNPTENEDAFDADVTIASGELGRLIPALLDAMGGELKVEA